MSEIGLAPIPDHEPMLKGLRAHFVQLVKDATQTTERIHRFPGTMPLTLSRRHLNMIATADYVALEKSDGTRYMLLAVADFVCLIDRQMRFYVIDPNPAIMSKGFASPQDNTCLDGELTYNIMTQQWEYLIYDAIAIDGDLNVAQTGFRQRMQSAEVFVAGPRCWAPFCSGLLRLRIKDYYEKRNIRQLFARIRRDPKGHYLYINNDRRDGVICNENDGVILSPVGMPYQVRNCPALLKWKPPHLNSIDFTLLLEKILDPRNNQPSVKCHIGYKGERGIVRMREVYFPSKLRRQFAANFNQFNNSVVELAYDRAAGEWKYIRRRDDKDGPNFSTTVIDTMETIAENMERQELVTHLEKSSRSPPQSEHELIQVVAKNVEVCTYRNDLFDDENYDYLVATPISLVKPPLISPPPRRFPRNRRPPDGRPPDGRPPEARMSNGNANPAAPSEETAGRAAFEYSDDV